MNITNQQYHDPVFIDMTYSEFLDLKNAIDYLYDSFVDSISPSESFTSEFYNNDGEAFDLTITITDEP